MSEFTKDQQTYRKGSFRMVDKGNGRVVLEETSVEDAAALDLQNGSLNLDTSGLSLHGDSSDPSDNPYDSGSSMDAAAAHWGSGTIR